jgi:hypothetical protein
VRYSLPVAVLAAAAVVALCVLPGLAAAAESQVVATALALDFTVVVPGLVYVLLVRARRVPWIVLVPTFAVGYAVAAAALPRTQQTALEALRLLAIPAELAALVYLALLARKTLAGAAAHGGDFATRLRSAARTALAGRVPADILTTEISLIYYAFRWRRPWPPGSGCFTVHREVGYLGVLLGLSVVLLTEAVAVHLLLSRWSSTAAWVLDGLSLYACVWLVGDYRAMAARPLRVSSTHLLVRVGVRWEADIALAAIERVDVPGWNEEPPKRSTLVAALLGQPNLRVRLKEPAEVIGMYGLRRVVREVWLTVDGAKELCLLLGGAAGT